MRERHPSLQQNHPMPAARSQVTESELAADWGDVELALMQPLDEFDSLSAPPFTSRIWFFQQAPTPDMLELMSREVQDELNHLGMDDEEDDLPYSFHPFDDRSMRH